MKAIQCRPVAASQAYLVLDTSLVLSLLRSLHDVVTDSITMFLVGIALHCIAKSGN